MSLRGDLCSARENIIGSDFVVRNGLIVPETTDVGYNDAVKLLATYLYADMVNSSGLVAATPTQIVGKVLRLYLDLSVRIIRHHDGHIRSFDGDRVMGVFIGLGRQDRAVKAAMQIEWACQVLIQPSIKQRYGSISKSGWVLRPGCGIASGEAFIIRGGVRQSSSDLVSVGVAPNLAAKLSDIRKEPFHVRISAGTYKGLGNAGRLSQGKNMWRGPHELDMGGKKYDYYRTNYRWAIT
jgi:adenylate cyclase